MSKPADLSCERIVRALERDGFVIKRQGKHLSMYSAKRDVVAVIPRHNPVKRTTLLRILKG
ncbi:MAG: type II toxin-antitoxin system HicA family toxin [Chloroflexi bacterium]|nr:type II toxin-antitoxin system HicA family toxin [Chloroflexota bacterium]